MWPAAGIPFVFLQAGANLHEDTGPLLLRARGDRNGDILPEPVDPMHEPVGGDEAEMAAQNLRQIRLVLAEDFRRLLLGQSPVLDELVYGGDEPRLLQLDIGIRVPHVVKHVAAAVKHVTFFCHDFHLHHARKVTVQSSRPSARYRFRDQVVSSCFADMILFLMMSLSFFGWAFPDFDFFLNVCRT